MPPKREGFSKEERAEVRQLDAELKRLLKMFEGIGFRDFIRYLGSMRRILFVNFLAGVARGFGIIVGMTVVVAMMIWMLSYLVDFPLIGEYFLQLKQLLERMAPGA